MSSSSSENVAAAAATSDEPTTPQQTKQQQQNLRSWRKKALSINRNLTAGLSFASGSSSSIKRGGGLSSISSGSSSSIGGGNNSTTSSPLPLEELATASTVVSIEKRSDISSNGSSGGAHRSNLKCQSGSLLINSSNGCHNNNNGDVPTFTTAIATSTAASTSSVLTPALMLSDVSSADADPTNSTPRSAVRLSFDRRGEAEVRVDSSSSNDAAATAVSCEAKKDGSSSSKKQHDKKSSSSRHHRRQQTPLQKTLTCTSYRDFVIRPLICEDYNANFLRFVARLGHGHYSKYLTNAKFRAVLLERKRTNHYTLVAICPDDHTYMAIGSVAILQCIFSDAESFAYIDDVFVDPQFKDTSLEERMVQRLLEIVELVPTATTLRIVYPTAEAPPAVPSGALMAGVKSASCMGTAYSFKIKRE